VLCFHPGEDRIARAAELCGLPVPEFLRAVWAHRLDYDAGLLEPAEYWRGVAREAGTHFADSLLPALVSSEVGFWSHFDQRVLDWSRDLRGAGVRTAILSNLPRPLGEELRATSGFLEHFDHVTFSYELRVVKPDARIYRHAFEGLGVEPGEALFLDDRPNNVEGAQAAGLRAVLYSTWEEFVASDVAARYGLPPPAEAGRS
jgi:putative hydrolase of the HAD superfamily